MEDHLASIQIEPGLQVLDVGCGDGWFVRQLIDRGVGAIGVECGVEMRRRALAADPAHPERYLDAVGQDLPFDDDSFDAVAFVFSLHHVPEPDMAQALAEAQRVVRPGGVVHSIEPVARGLGHDVDALVDDETHVRELAQNALDQMVADGVEELDRRPLAMATSYADFADYEQILVGIDPGRAAVMAGARASVEQAFYTNAIEHADRWWFEDHLLIRSFRPYM